MGQRWSNNSILEETNSGTSQYCPIHQVWPPPNVQQDWSLDVIFFHGLQFRNGDRTWRDTWVQRGNREVCWPAEWLPMDLGENVRIFLLQYDAAVGGNTDGVDEIAHQLTESLVRSKISGVLPWEQPIVLVGHSFGGLVIKSLVVNVARRARESKAPTSKLDQELQVKAEAFLASVRGIVFYATPHLGGNFENFCKSSCAQESYVDRIIQNVYVLDTAMACLSKSFEAIVQDKSINVYCFAEGLPTDMVKVTSTASAIQMCGEHYCKLEDSNHLEISKPPSRSHFIYQKCLDICQLCRSPGDFGMSENSGLYVHRHLVGLDEVVKEIVYKLHGDWSADNVIGIWGMGGIGKTTIAKEVYNKIREEFDAVCLLEDVKESAERSGVVGLQQTLLDQLCRGKKVTVSSVSNGQQLLRRYVGVRKVLVVVDNPGDENQVDALLVRGALKAGSCGILTVRDKGIFQRSDLNVKEHEVPLLGESDANKLFMLHAFAKGRSSDISDALAESIASACGGLPLVLEIIGAHLKGSMDLEVWEEVLICLNNNGFLDESDLLFKRLRISFDALEENHKKIFLDIVCHLGAYDSRDIECIWKASGWSPRKALHNLINKSLLKVENGKFIIHDTIQEMGRKIVTNESLEAGKRSRLAMPESERALAHNKVTYKVEAISLLGSVSGNSAVDLTSMERLRILELNECNWSFTHFPIELRFLSWRGMHLKSLPSGIVNLKLLAYLDLSGSKIEKLVEEGCEWKLLGLRKLVMMKCSNLQELPATTGQSSGLEKLVLDGCSKLKGLPESMGDLSNLQHLDLEECTIIIQLPHSLCHLRHLTTLYLHGAKMKEVPDCIGHLLALRRLYLRSFVLIKTFPRLIQNLQGLLTLGCEGCTNMESICESFQWPTKLKELFLNGSLSLTKLPEAIGQLSNLEVLELAGCKCLESVPMRIGDLKKLRKIDLGGCTKLVHIPESILELSQKCQLEFTRLVSCLCDEGLNDKGNNFEVLKDLLDRLNVVSNASQSFESVIMEGNWCQSHGAFTMALLYFNRAQKLRPNHICTLVQRGVIKRELKDFEGSLVDLDSANSLKPNDMLTLQERGVTKRELRDLKGSLVDLNRADELKPNDVWTLEQRGVTRRELKDMEGSLMDLNKANRLQPNNVSILQQTYVTKRELKDLEGSLVDLDRAHELQLNNARTLRQRGMTKRDFKDLEGSLVDLDRANALEPNNAQTLRQRGMTKRDLKDFEGSLVDLDRADELEPNNAWTLWRRGMTKRYLNDLEGSLVDLNRAHELQPNDAWILRQRGMTKRELKDLEGSLLDLDIADELQPNDVWILRQRGLTKRDLKDLEGSLVDLDREDELWPNNAWTLRQRGLTKGDLKDFKGSLMDLDRADGLEPNIAWTLWQKGMTKRNLNDLEGSLVDFDRASELQPNDARILQEKGVTKRYLKDLKGSLMDLDRAYGLEPNDAWTLRQRGVTKKKLKDFEGSLVDLGRADGLQPNHAWTLEEIEVTKRELKDLKGSRVDLDI